MNSSRVEIVCVQVQGTKVAQLVEFEDYLHEAALEGFVFPGYPTITWIKLNMVSIQLYRVSIPNRSLKVYQDQIFIEI